MFYIYLIAWMLIYDHRFYAALYDNHLIEKERHRRN